MGDDWVGEGRTAEIIHGRFEALKKCKELMER
jgi:hypothetical protein